jgi:hypothetical protein
VSLRGAPLRVQGFPPVGRSGLQQFPVAPGNPRSTLEACPAFHQRGDAIRGPVFYSFLALVLHKELHRRLDAARHSCAWSDIQEDLRALPEIALGGNGKRFALRSQCLGSGTSVFKAVGGCHSPCHPGACPTGGVCSAENSRWAYTSTAA